MKEMKGRKSGFSVKNLFLLQNQESLEVFDSRIMKHAVFKRITKEVLRLRFAKLLKEI